MDKKNTERMLERRTDHIRTDSEESNHIRADNKETDHEELISSELNTN